MIAAKRKVLRQVTAVTVVVDQEGGQEIGVEGLGRQEQLKLEDLILQPVAHLERPPGEMGVARLRVVDGALADAAVGVVVVDQRILLHPVEVLKTPLAGIFLVARRPVALAHRHPPLHAVQLPAQLVVLHGPVLPVDILPIKIRGLIARMHEEAVLQTVVGPAALGLGRLCRGGVEVGRLDTGAAAVVGQQGILGLHRVAAAQRLGHRLQTGTVEIQTLEEGLVADGQLLRTRPPGRKRGQQRGAADQNRSGKFFHIR